MGYSEEKTYSEQIIADRFPENYTILRPGPIKGWRDPAVDVAYWLLRFQTNRKVLASGNGKGPRAQTLTFKEFLGACKSHSASEADIVRITLSFLREHKVRSFDDLPLWVPLSEDPGFMQISSDKANRQGFVYSPLDDTYRDILRWYREGLCGSHNFGREHGSVGLTAERGSRSC